MERHLYDTALDQIDTLIGTLDGNEKESELFIIVEIAHQFREELVQLEPEEYDADL